MTAKTYEIGAAVTPPQYGDFPVQHGVQLDIYNCGRTVAINVDGICMLRLVLRPGQLVEVTDEGKLVTVLTNGRG